MFIECPGAWVLRYHYGYKTEPSARMKKGMSYEDKVNEHLAGGYYDDVTFGLTGEELASSENTAEMIANIYGDDTFILQKRLETDDKIGYLDYANDNHIVDLKTTSRTPSTPTQAHLRQMAFYRSFYENAGKPVPKLTLIYVVFLKASIKTIVATNDDALYNDDYIKDKYCDNMLWITEEALGRAAMENVAAENALRVLYWNDWYVKVLPININHYYLSDFDSDVLDRYLSGTLAPAQQLPTGT